MNRAKHPYYDVVIPFGWDQVKAGPAKMGDKHLVEDGKPWPLAFNFISAQRCGEPALGFRCLIRQEPW